MVGLVYSLRRARHRDQQVIAAEDGGWSRVEIDG